MQTDPFKEYLKQQEPDKKYKGYAWQTAIGLQAVDGLKPSEYLVDAAIQNIEGKITLDEVKKLLDSYYEEKPQKYHDRTEEADKVSIRIAKILSEHAFSFTPNEYISIHRKLSGKNLHGVTKLCAAALEADNEIHIILTRIVLVLNIRNTLTGVIARIVTG